MIQCQVMIWLIETNIQYLEYEVEIHTFMKVSLCYTTRYDAKVTLRHDVVVVPAST